VCGGVDDPSEGVETGGGLGGAGVQASSRSLPRRSTRRTREKAENAAEGPAEPRFRAEAGQGELVHGAVSPNCYPPRRLQNRITPHWESEPPYSPGIEEAPRYTSIPSGRPRGRKPGSAAGVVAAGTDDPLTQASVPCKDAGTPR
jgi:hypothetical protein